MPDLDGMGFRGVVQTLRLCRGNQDGDAWVWFVIVLLAVLMIFATMFALWLLRKIDRTADSILAELPEEEDVEP